METLTIALICIIFLLVVVIWYMIVQKRKRDAAEANRPIVVHKKAPLNKPLIKPLGPFRFPDGQAPPPSETHIRQAVQPMRKPLHVPAQIIEGFSTIDPFYIQQPRDPAISKKFSYSQIG